MSLQISPSGQPFGASVTGVDLSRPVSDSVADEIRTAWLQYHVLAFPEQSMDDDDLERFTLMFGPFGDDPFIYGHPSLRRCRGDTASPHHIVPPRNWP